MVLPLTNSYLLTLPKLGHKELVPTSLSAVLAGLWEQRPKSFLSGGDAVGQTAARPFAASTDILYEKHHWVSEPRLGIMRLGVVARHFSPRSHVIKTIVELLLTQRMGSTWSLRVSSVGALCRLCVPRAVALCCAVLCCAVLGGSRSHWSYMSLEAGFRAVFPFYPHYGWCSLSQQRRKRQTL